MGFGKGDGGEEEVGGSEALAGREGGDLGGGGGDEVLWVGELVCGG